MSGRAPVPVISTVDTSSRPYSLPYIVVISFIPFSMMSSSHYLHILSFFPPFLINAIISNRKRKENARLGNNKDKNENAASNTNATHVNPGPRQQSALDIVLAETGAQCRISIIHRDDKEFSCPRRGFAKPNDKAEPTIKPKRIQRNKPWTSMPSPYAGELRLLLFPGWSGQFPSV